jgi:hypothetical protein
VKSFLQSVEQPKQEAVNLKFETMENFAPDGSGAQSSLMGFALYSKALSIRKVRPPDLNTASLTIFLLKLKPKESHEQPPGDNSNRIGNLSPFSLNISERNRRAFSLI